MIFQYMMLTVFFCYLALAGMKKYRKWTLHYVWTIPYIVYSFMINVFRIENIYVNNFGEIADRKSTRLNSSHANISYAVFCLKKKTPNHIIIAHFYPPFKPIALI